MTGLLIMLAATVIAIVVVLGAMSLVLMGVAKPKGRDLELLTSGAPGETVLNYWVANAVINTAEVNAFGRLAFRAAGAVGEDVILRVVKKLAGGTWVGGRVILTSHRLVFMPNRLNRALQKGVPVIAVRLTDIASVQSRFGMVTRILDVETGAGVLSLRGPRPGRFIAAVDGARGAHPDDQIATR